LDAGRLKEGEPHLAGTARLPVARMSAATAAGIGATDAVIVSTARGYVSMRLEITEMPNGVVWMPLNSTGSPVHRLLGVTTGAVVRIEAGGFR
jgi:NADH-quinone oxidoreductase subunit G